MRRVTVLSEADAVNDDATDDDAVNDDAPDDAGTEPYGMARSGAGWCGVRVESGEVPAVVVRERVRLDDTDSSGLIYYGAVTRWLTRAQFELWLALGFRQEGLLPSPMMPVVDAHLRYHGPLALGDPYELRVWIDEAGATSLTVAFEIGLDGVTKVDARMIHVHLDATSGRPSPLPAAMVAAARTRRPVA